jgi:hypothetical protein
MMESIMTIYRNESYEIFWDNELGWAFKAKGKKSEIDWQSSVMDSSPFELGHVISSIRYKYLPNEVPNNEDIWQVKDASQTIYSLSEALAGIHLQNKSIDELMIEAATLKEANDPIILALQKLLTTRLLWWMNKYGCIATKSEYMTMSNIITQAKLFEWVFEFQIAIQTERDQVHIRGGAPVKIDSNFRQPDGSGTTSLEEFSRWINDNINNGKIKFVRNISGNNEPLNMQGALWLIAEKQLQNGKIFRRCGNSWIPCMSLVEIKDIGLESEYICSERCSSWSTYYA